MSTTLSLVWCGSMCYVSLNLWTYNVKPQGIPGLRQYQYEKHTIKKKTQEK